MPAEVSRVVLAEIPEVDKPSQPHGSDIFENDRFNRRSYRSSADIPVIIQSLEYREVHIGGIVPEQIWTSILGVIFREDLIKSRDSRRFILFRFGADVLDPFGLI